MRISDWSSDVCSSDLDAQSRRHDVFGVELGPKLCQQIILLGGIGTLQTAEVAQIMAFPHEFRRRELHCRPWRRGETRGDLGKAGHEIDRSHDNSVADTRKHVVSGLSVTVRF